MTRYMRHGEDDEREGSATKGSLTTYGVRQVTESAQRLLMVLLEKVEGLTGINIIHSPNKRTEESAQILQEILETKIPVKKVVADDFLRHKGADDMDRENVYEFHQKYEPAEGEENVFISHNDSLGSMLFFSYVRKVFGGLVKSGEIKYPDQNFKHGTIKDEHGNPI